MRRKIIVSLVLVIGFLTTGAAVMLVLVKNRAKPARTEITRPALLVEWVEVSPRTVPETINGYGTARADRYARLSAQVFGEVIWLAGDPDPETNQPVPGLDVLKPGAGYDQGDVLLRIDDREYQQMLAQARAAKQAEEQQLAELDVEEKNLETLLAIVQNQHDLQKAEFDRVMALRQRQAANVSEFRQQRLALAAVEARLQEVRNNQAVLPKKRAALEASIKSREAQIKVAELNVERCTITAPFAGRIEQLMVERGERVQAGMTLLTMLDPSLLEVPVELPVSIRDRVSVGAPCTLTLESVAENCWQGRVKRISPSADPTTRTFELYVEVSEADQGFPLLPGYFLRAEIEGPTLENVLLVPRNAIQQNEVFVYDDGRSVPRTIEVERQLFDESVVTGLDAGSIVITSNLDVLYEGAPVRLEGGPDRQIDEATAEADETQLSTAAGQHASPLGEDTASPVAKRRDSTQ